MASPYRSALVVAGSYFSASVLWWLVTGRLLNTLFDDSAAIAHGQMVSGYVWAAASALMLFAWRSRLLRLMGREYRARAANRERLNMAAAVFDSTLEGVLVTDANNVIVHVNRAFMDITGYSQDEVLGQNPNKFKSGRHDAAFYHRVYTQLNEQGQWRGEIWNRRKNGEIYPQWQTIRVVRDEFARVTHYVAVFSDLSLAKRSEQELAHRDHYDALTELPNRALLQDRVEQGLRQAQSEKHGGTLLMIDLDYFQNINDSYGHGLGDRVLRAVAQRLSVALSPSQTLARLGGDEFALFDEHCGQLAEAAALARRLLDQLVEPFELEERSLFVSASIGISLFPNDASDAEQLLRNADSALFKAKQSGRAGYAFYTEALTAQAQQRLEIATELRRAIEQNELRVFYQPVVNLLTGGLAGVEALVRWQHPERGLVPPGEFIPVAEHSGLIADIDRWVLAEACRQRVRWIEAGWRDGFVAVNLSSRLFGRPEVECWVAQTLRETGLPPALLELEVTESAVMDDPDTALEQLHRLRALGLHLAIDDFGTGYSSLLRLKSLPVNKLKIDQGFVAGLPGDDSDAAIVRAVIVLARSMGMTVHAEGIEHPEQARFLLEHQCELGQGYGFSRPVPADQIELKGI